MNLETNIWIVYVSGIYLMSISGTAYLFPAYSQDVRLYFNYTTEQINFIGTMGNAGVWAGVFAGLFLDKFGPRRTAIGGSLMIFLGYFCLYLCSLYVLPTVNWLVGIFAFIAGQGSSWTYFAALNPSTGNFKAKNRGKIVGSLVCFFGLCSAIYTRFYSLFRTENGNDLSGFFLFLAIVLSLIGIIGGLASNYVTVEYYGDVNSRIMIVYALGIFLALYLSASSIVESTVEDLSNFWIVFLTVIAMLLYGSFVLLTLKSGKFLYESKDTKLKNEKESIEILQRQSYTLWELFKIPDMYLIFFVQMTVIGSGVMILNNLSSIVISKSQLAVDSRVSIESIPMYSSLPTFVILFAACNTFGRMIFGTLSDIFLHRFNRGIWYIICALSMLFCQFYFMFCTIPMIYIGVVFLGLCYGGTFSLTPTIISELFGMKHFGANWGFLQIAGAIGSQLISVLLAGKLSDYLEKDGKVCILKNEQCNWQCLGYHCYRYTFIVTIILCVLAVVAAVILTMRMRNKKTVLVVQ